MSHTLIHWIYKLTYLWADLDVKKEGIWYSMTSIVSSPNAKFIILCYDLDSDFLWEF